MKLDIPADIKCQNDEKIIFYGIIWNAGFFYLTLTAFSKPSETKQRYPDIMSSRNYISSAADVMSIGMMEGMMRMRGYGVG